jgi:sporulation protein YlmC with PRC-barrel domain
MPRVPFAHARKMLVPALGLSLVLGAHAGAHAGAGAAGAAGATARPIGVVPGGATLPPDAALAPPATQRAPQAVATPVAEPRALLQLVPAGQLIGMNVRNPAGEDLGEIDDVVVDAQQNRALFAVIGFGGFFGFGERLFAYPLHVLQLAPGRDAVILDVPRERLEHAPGFDRAHLPDWRNYLDQVEAFWGPAQGTGWAGAAVPGTAAGTARPVPPPGGVGIPGAVGDLGAAGTPGGVTAPGTDGQPAAVRRETVVPPILGATAVPGAAAAVDPMPPEVRTLRAVRASDLINRNIREIGRLQPIGQVNDVVLDFRSGRIEFAVVSFDQGWLRQDHLVTIPIDALRRDHRFPRELVLEMTKEQLAQAPTFHPAQWPQFEEADFRGAWDRFLATFEARRGPGDVGASTPATQTQPASGPAAGTGAPISEPVGGAAR